MSDDLLKRCIAFLALLLTACEPSELRPIPFPAGGGSGGGYAPAPARPAPQTSPVAPPPSPSTIQSAPSESRMLDDPEAQTEEWEDDAFADSLEKAESICRQKAENMSQRGAAVKSLGARHISGKLYMCKFSTEVPRP